MVFGTDEPFEGSLGVPRFLRPHARLLAGMVRRLAFSIDWQDEHRAAITSSAITKRLAGSWPH
jgi:hypothetical protein